MATEYGLSSLEDLHSVLDLLRQFQPFALGHFLPAAWKNEEEGIRKIIGADPHGVTYSSLGRMPPVQATRIPQRGRSDPDLRYFDR